MRHPDELKPGYMFDTVFWIEKDPDVGPALVGSNINGQKSGLPVITRDTRVLPGRRCKVKVERVSDDAIYVGFLGLVNFKLDQRIYVDPTLLRHYSIHNAISL